MDFNSHVRNTAYLDKSADSRMYFFAEYGFPMAEFMRLKMGPVIRKDELEYFHEIHLLDEMRVVMKVSGLSEDGSRFIIVNEFWKGQELAAKVTSYGGWIDLTKRKLRTPPERLHTGLKALLIEEGFKELPSLG